MHRIKIPEKWAIPAVIIVGALIIFLREPSIFLHYQFWGEDGKYWYGQAYNHGKFITLFWAYAGSLQFALRLVGSLTTLLPFVVAPLLFAIAAAIFQLLPAVLLATKRFSKAFGSLSVSLLVAAFYLLIPNSFEVNSNLTNVGWHLSLLAFMVLVVKDSKGKWRYFDYAILILAGLTGPFSIMLLPIAYYFWKHKKTTITHFLIVAVAALAQVLTYLISHGGSRLSEGLGASPVRFLSIIGGRIFAALLLGMKTVGSGSSQDLLLSHSYRFAFLGLITLFLVIYVGWKGPVRLKALIFLSWITFFIALSKPQASSTLTQWRAIIEGAGNRYFLLPMISLFCGFVWLAYSKNKYIKIPAIIAILVVFCIAIPRDFSYTPEPYQNFSLDAKQFSIVPKNRTYCFNVNPSPDWRTCLKKH